MTRNHFARRRTLRSRLREIGRVLDDRLLDPNTVALVAAVTLCALCGWAVAGLLLKAAGIVETNTMAAGAAIGAYVGWRNWRWSTRA